MTANDADSYESVEKPWQDADILRGLYHEQRLTQQEIGDLLECSPGAVKYQMQQHGITTRDPNDGRYDDAPWRDADTLRQLYLEDRMTMECVSDELGCSVRTVEKWLNRHDIPTRDAAPGSGDNLPWRDEDTLRELYIDERLSQPEIAERLGCKPSVICVWMAKYDIPVRDHGEAVSLALTGESKHRDAERLAELYLDREWTMQHIGDHFGVDDTVIWHYLHKYGIETRDPANAPVYDDALAARDVYYGPNWKEQSAARREFDDHECVVCGLPNDTHKDQFGSQLHVHHITPLRRYYDPEAKSIDYELSNRLENLLTLCRTHHYQWEGIPLRPDIR